jgi:hypothetical protein
MTKTMLRIPSIPRALALAALLVIVGLSVGGAFAERMEQRSSEDRLTIGEIAGQD